MKYQALLIDKITECIEDMATGQFIETEFLEAAEDDLKYLYKKNGWSFTWKSFLKYPNRKSRAGKP